MANKRAILWFRQDLRVHDNEALVEALSMGTDIIPVYVFDERIFKGKTMFGFSKCGVHRTQFIIESILDLRETLHMLGTRLIVRIGKPEEVLCDMANTYKTNWVYCNRERTSEEKYVQDTLEKNLWSIGQEMRFSRGKMLYYTADLPFPITHTPDSFSTFKKEVEKIVQIREPLSVPSLENSFPKISIEDGLVPEINDLDNHSNTGGIKSQSKIKGGENAGLMQLFNFLKNASDTDKGDTIYNDPTMHFNSQISAYLSQGCLSPKRVYFETKKQVDDNLKAPLFQQVFNRLMYRDYLRLMGKKYGNLIFQRGGVIGAEVYASKNVSDNFEKWRKGETGQKLIDAIMKQLNNIGFCTDHARKLSATYLIKEMDSHWRWGASWFESQLIDYDPCSNWVNWMNTARLGPDQKEERKLNYNLQSKRLDPKGKFLEKWN